MQLCLFFVGQVMLDLVESSWLYIWMGMFRKLDLSWFVLVCRFIVFVFLFIVWIFFVGVGVGDVGGVGGEVGGQVDDVGGVYVGIGGESCLGVVEQEVGVDVVYVCSLWVR